MFEYKLHRFLSVRYFWFCYLILHWFALGCHSLNHTRVRRYLSFPKGSSIQCVYCFIGTTPGTEPAGIFTIGITVGLAWEIPTDIYQVLRKHNELQLHTRDRRQLYPKIQAVLDKLGDDGKSCVLRALCQASRWQATKDISFLQLILITIFRFPLIEAEDSTHEEYNEAIKQNQNCLSVYPCNTEILSLYSSFD